MQEVLVLGRRPIAEMPRIKRDFAVNRDGGDGDTAHAAIVSEAVAFMNSIPYNAAFHADTCRKRHQENTARAYAVSGVALHCQHARSQDCALSPRPPRLGGGIFHPICISHDRRNRRSLRKKDGTLFCPLRILCDCALLTVFHDLNAAPVGSRRSLGKGGLRANIRRVYAHRHREPRCICSIGIPGCVDIFLRQTKDRRKDVLAPLADLKHLVAASRLGTLYGHRFRRRVSHTRAHPHHHHVVALQSSDGSPLHAALVPRTQTFARQDGMNKPTSLRFEAIFFDMDGLLVDTESIDFKGTKEVFASAGLDLTREWYIHEHLGKGRSVSELLRENGVAEHHIAELREMRHKRYWAYLEVDATAIDGVPETLQKLYGKFLLAIVTGSYRQSVDIIMRKTGLRDFFDF